MIVSKGGLELSFDRAIGIVRLAGSTDLGRSDIELVDFSVETDDRYLFVSIFDTHAGASSELASRIARAFRDSVFYHLFGEWDPKRIELDVLCMIPGIDAPLASVLADDLRRRIPLSHPSWSVESAAGVYVLTEGMWRKKFGEDSIRRI